MALTNPQTRLRRWRRAVRAFFAGLLFGSGAAHALAPHEVALLINAHSPASLEIANAYAELRNIPFANRVYLPLPEKVRAAAGEIDPEEFRNWIWNPARTHLREQGLEDHILAWVYSVDFPYRITTQPAMSIHGLTLLRGETPPFDLVEKAQYVSPYYAGPDEPEGPRMPTRALALRHLPSTREMPVPSFSLGHVGARGLSSAEVLKHLARSRAADHSAPPGAVLFFTNDNIRSTARAWQFPGAVSELHALGRKAEIIGSPPQQASGLVGFMTGQLQAPGHMRNRLAPGAIADHLTSHAANFNAWQQGKCTTWLRFGAAASAGTVTEPYALWPKFPHARLHVHYAAGLTALESFYQALRCPLQLFLVGDPLCAPFAPNLTLELSAEVAEDESNVALSSRLTGPQTGTRAEYTLYLNDRIIERHPTEAPRRVSTRDLPDGFHTLRLVAEIPTPLRPTAVAETTFQLQRQGRGVTLLPPATPDALLIDRPYPLAFTAEGHPARVHLYSGRLLLSTVEAQADALILEPARLGAGPNRLHAIAEYADGQRVAGKPVAIRIVEPGRTAVRLEAIPEADRLRLRPSIETDALHMDAGWHRRLDARAEPDAFRMRGGEISVDDAGTKITAEDRLAVYTERRPPRRSAPTAIQAEILIPGAERDALAGIAFNVRNANTFDFFGMHGRTSAWVFGTMNRGTLSVHQATGAPLVRGQWMALHLRRGADGMEGLVDGRVVARWPRGDWGRGDVGLFARNAKVPFRNWMERPPGLLEQAEDMSVLVDPAHATSLAFVAWDGFRFVSAAHAPPSMR